ncbi:transposase-like protein [Peribacillus simplex]|nr:hypothetical protein [Peribacillus simplex]MDF9761363.1 transposase-like protein [Peribacillus simplex]
MTKRKRRTFTSEFKQQIIEHYQKWNKDKYSVSAMCGVLELSRST